ncbi:MAG: LTA synthase family protein [Opitutaceae bacterium]
MPSAPRLVRWIASVSLILVVAMSLLRLGAYIFLVQHRIPVSEAWSAFGLGLRFDVRVVAGSMLPLLVLGAMPWINPFTTTLGRRLWMVALGCLTGLLLIAYAADFLHFRYLNQRLNASVLGLVTDTGIAAGMVWQTYPVARIVLAIAIGLAGFIAAFAILRRRIEATPVATTTVSQTIWYVGTGILCVLGVFGRIGQYPLRWSDAYNLRNATLANLALNPVQSFVSSMNFRTSGYDLDKVKGHYAFMSSYLGVSSSDRGQPTFERQVPAARSATVPPNVVLVICESFSAYKSSMWGNPLDTTPFFAELCRQGLFFDNCYTPHYGTARGVWATLTGTPDVEAVETASRNPALVDQHTIINNFEVHEKFYFIGGSSSWANIRGLLTNNIKGLNLYEEGSFASPRADVWGISDKNLFLEANAVLARQTKPFFAVIQTADNHRPYTIPKEDLPEFAKVEVATEQLRQFGFDSLEELNAFRYTDFCFRKFIEAARQAPYFENTIFVFVGDHGIDGNAGTMFPPAWTTHQLTAYHVPLLFYSPKRLPPQRVHAVASMVDILPTVAGIAGISYRNTTLGRDLVQRMTIDGGASNVAFIIDRHDQWIGIVKQRHFARHGIDGTNPEVLWADFREPARIGSPPPDENYHDLVNAFYETSRYLLLHNRKPSSQP